MPNQFQSSSFIPKGGAEYKGPTKRSKRSTGMLLTISMVVAGLAAVAAAGVFFYTQYLESNLEDKKQEFAQAQAAFEPDIIEQLDYIDTRMSSAQDLLAEHTAATPVFDVVESVTVVSVQVTGLSIISPQAAKQQNPAGSQAEQENSGPERVQVSMQAVAPDYAAVALQVQAMSRNEAILEPELMEFTLNEQGNVDFTINFLLGKEYMRYQTTI